MPTGSGRPTVSGEAVCIVSIGHHWLRLAIREINHFPWWAVDELFATNTRYTLSFYDESRYLNSSLYVSLYIYRDFYVYRF